VKKVDEFVAEETGEEWCRELYKVVSQRRGVMFRLVSDTARMLLLGNAGGAALIIGLITAYGFGGESKAVLYHWSEIFILSVFGLGVLASAATTILVALVSVKEAHSAEIGLKRFIELKEDRSSVLFFLEPQNIYLANIATVLGVLSAACFLLGAISSLLLLILVF